MPWLRTVYRVDNDPIEFDERPAEDGQPDPEGPEPDEVALRAARRRRGRRLDYRNAQRLSRDTLLRRAAHLPDTPRALLTASLGLGMTCRELAAIHRVTPRGMRHRLDRLKARLCDPCFLLTTQFADQLPAELGGLARAYWIENRPLRALAAQRSQTLHRIRREIALARSLLLLAMASRQQIPADLAQAALMNGFRHST